MFPQEVDVVPSPVFSPVLLARPRSLRVSHHLETFHPVTLLPLSLTPRTVFLPDVSVKGLKVTWKNQTWRTATVEKKRTSLPSVQH